jgi:hypothetical protein
MQTTLKINSRIALAGTTAGVGTGEGLDKSVAVPHGNDDRHGAPIGADGERRALVATCGRRYQSSTGSAPCGGPLTQRRRGRNVPAASMECTWCGHVPQPPREAR